jgi:hypothetical protein
MLLKGIAAPFDAHEIRRDVVRRSIDILKALQDERPLNEEPHEHPFAVERQSAR